MSRPSPRDLLTRRKGWLSDWCQVLCIRPTRWESLVQRLEITTGELLPNLEIPLLKSRRELSRAEALKIGAETARQAGGPADISGDRHRQPRLRRLLARRFGLSLNTLHVIVMADETDSLSMATACGGISRGSPRGVGR